MARARIRLLLVATIVAIGCGRGDANDWAKARFGEKDALALVHESFLLTKDEKYDGLYLPRPFVIFVADETARSRAFHPLNKSIAGVAQSRREVAAYVQVYEGESEKVFAYTKRGKVPITTKSKTQTITIRVFEPNPTGPLAKPIVTFHAWVEGHSTSALEEFLMGLPSTPPG